MKYIESYNNYNLNNFQYSKYLYVIQFLPSTETNIRLFFKICPLNVSIF